MKQYGYTDNKEAVLKRLKRAEGQVRGIAHMVEKDTYCIDILTQVNAAQAALDKVALELLRDHTNYCLHNAKSEQEKREKTDEIVSAINRMLSR
jgi:DNA-binding FrmR family transcriptional regulator